MKQIDIIARKEVPLIYRKIHKAFEERAISGKLDFSDARYVLGAYFRIPRNECRKIFDELESFELIELMPFHGIKLLQTSPRW